MAEPPTKAELLTPIEERKREPELSQPPYAEQHEVILERGRPLREAMRERDRRILEGLDCHGLN